MLIQITRKCNENCSHCMVDALPEGPHMDRSTFIKAVNFGVVNKIPMINISGGDPILHPNFFYFMSYLLDKLHGTNIFVAIESNGWWIGYKRLCDRINKLLDNRNILALQISTNKRYYPNYEWTMSHKSDFEKLHNKIKFTADWQGIETPLRRLGRAKNIISEDEVKGLPGCMNFVSYALQRDNLGLTGGHVFQQLIYFAALRGKTCVPFIKVNGDVCLSEGIECKPIANINDWYNRYNNSEFCSKLLDAMTSFIPCDHCKCCKNFTIDVVKMLDEARVRWGLDPKFIDIYIKKLHNEYTN